MAGRVLMLCIRSRLKHVKIRGNFKGCVEARRKLRWWKSARCGMREGGHGSNLPTEIRGKCGRKPRLGLASYQKRLGRGIGLRGRRGRAILYFVVTTLRQANQSNLEAFFFFQKVWKLYSMRKYGDVLIIDLDEGSSCLTRCQACVSHSGFWKPGKLLVIYSSFTK